MKKLLKKFKTLGLITLVAGGAITMAACSNEKKEARNNFNATMKDRINEQMDEFAPLSFEVDRFEFLGADFNQTGKMYSVELSGIARNKDNDKSSYINAGINVKSSKLNEINDPESLTEMLNFLSEAVKNHQFEYLEFLPVENIKDISAAVTKSLESPAKDFGYNSGMLYAVSKPEINKEEGFAVFQTKSYVKYSKTSVQTTFGIVGTNADGSLRYGMITTSVVDYDFYIHTNNIYVKANQKELDNMANNPTAAFNKFVKAYNNEEKNNYVIQSVEVQKVKDFNTNMFNTATLNIEK